MEKSILEVRLVLRSRQDILEQIKKYIEKPSGFFHIVSINPENLISSQENLEFKKVIEAGQIQLIDGVGVVIAGKILGFELERFTGVDLMQELMKLANTLRLRVVLIGGKQNLAIQLAECYSRSYPKAKFFGLEGIKNIKNPLASEEKNILSIVSQFKPHLLFAAFGSPDQELWLDRHKSHLTGIVCMGVGGAFDYLAGVVPRAPKFLRLIGLEWLFRLTIEPWRWRRQLRLLKFSWLVFLSLLFGHSGENPERSRRGRLQNRSF